VSLVTGPAVASRSFSHRALFYRAPEDYTAQVSEFLRAGLAAGEPALVAVPGRQYAWLREALADVAANVRFADITRIGRNPAWIIPTVQEFADASPGKRVRYVGEPIWPARTAAELREATRHEALLNLAFAGANAEILCPYDVTRLTPAIIGDARRTHPILITDGAAAASQFYAGPGTVPASCQIPLTQPPPDAMSMNYTRDLSAVRSEVEKQARQARLPETKIVDLVLAVGEVAANTVRHAHSPGTLDISVDEREIVCTIRDSGTITDPLAGRRRPKPDALDGHGLWLVHQVCDLVEMRSGSSGTAIRLHMSLSS
jgi:anti-sigma regulatory factor (Ser/Thr protein kinase)